MLWTSAPKCSCMACSGRDLSGGSRPNGPGGKPRSLRDALVTHKAEGCWGELEPECAALPVQLARQRQGVKLWAHLPCCSGTALHTWHPRVLSSLSTQTLCYMRFRVGTGTSCLLWISILHSFHGRGRVSSYIFAPKLLDFVH